MSVSTGVNIKGNNRDLLQAIASSKVALASLRDESRKQRVEGQLQERQLRNINNELRRQSQALRGVALDYVGVRRAVLSFSTRAAVVGIGQLTAALNDAATGATDLGVSMTNAGAASAIGFGAVIGAALQGTSVLKVAMAGVGTAITSAGTAHEKALDKLTKPQRDFVAKTGQLREAYRQLQLVSQQGLFPGLESALGHISSKLLPILRTNIYDTSQMIGYLADRGVGMLNKRLPEFDGLMKRNIKTIEKGGRTIENFGAGFLDAFPKVEPLIAHMTSQVENFSAKFKDAISSKSGGDTLQRAITDIQRSWDNWTGTIGHAGKALFFVWQAIQPVVDTVENAIEGVAKKAEVWTGSHQSDIYNYFEGGLKPLGSFAKLVGQLAKDFGSLASKNNEGLAATFDGIRTKVLPVVMDIADALGQAAPNVGKLITAVLNLVQVSIPGIKSITSVLGPLTDGFVAIANVAAKIIEYFNQFGSAAGAIATLAVGATVIGAWKTLRNEIRLTMQAISYGAGLSTTKPSKGAFIEALPGNRVIPKAYNALGGASRSAANAERDTATRTFMAGGIPGMTEAEYKQWKAGNRVTRTGGAYSTLNIARQQGATVRLSPSDLRKIAPMQAIPQQYMPTGGTVMPANPSSGLVGNEVITGANIPVQRRDKNGRVYYADPTTGKRVSKPPLLARTAKGNIVSTVTGKYKTNIAGKTGGTSSVIRSFGFSPSELEAAAYGASASVAAQTSVEHSAQGGVGKALAHFKSPDTKGLAMYAGAIKRFIGPIFASLALIGGIEGLAESKSPSLLGKAKDVLSGVTQGLYAGPTKQAENQKTNVENYLTSARRAAPNDFSPLALNALTKNSFKQLGGKGASFIAKDSVSGTPRLDLTKLDADEKEALKKFAEIVEAGQDLSKRKINIPLDGSVTQEGAQKVIFALDEMNKLGSASIGDIRKRTKQNMHIIKDSLGSDSEAGKEALSANYNAAAAAIKRSMAEGVTSTHDGFAAIGKLFEQNMRAWGFSAKDAKHYAQKNNSGDTTGRGETNLGYQGAARGALLRLPGAVGPDSIPMNVNGRSIMAAPGEDVAIINRHQRKYIDQRLADVGGLSGVFRGITRPHNYAQGGWVSGDTDYLPSVGSDLAKMAKAKGVPIFVQSGRRTVAEQQEQINKWGANNPNHPVAGLNGPHVQGIAADITPGREVFGDIAGRFGLGFTVPQESWHVQLLNAAQKATGTGASSIKRVLAQGVSGQLGTVVQGALDSARSAVNDTLGSISASGLGDGGTTSGGGKTSAGGIYNKAMLKALWIQAGGPASVANIAAAIALAESSGNPDAGHDHPYHGLWQVGPGGSFDPLTNAKEAVAKYEAAGGFTPWTTYTGYDTPNHEKTYLRYLTRGGIIPAALGMFGYTVAPPTTGVDPGAPDTTQAIPKGTTKDSSTKKKKAKKKKKNTRDIAGGKPRLGAGISRSQFKPKRAKSLPIRKSIRKLLEDTFKQDTFSAQDLFDPYTGEQLDLGDIYPGVHNLDMGGKFIGDLQDQLGVAQSRADSTDETFLVEMQDTDQFKDLTNYLLSIGETDPEAWKAKYGDTYELVNDVPGGRMVQGKRVRGISEYVAEMNDLLSYHLTRQSSPLQQLMPSGIPGAPGGIMGLMGWQQNYAGGIPADDAIAERRAKLAKIKDATEATIELRKAQFRKLSGMKKKGYSYKTAIDHNKDIIQKWQNWKRDSYGESHGETRQANSEIDRLKNENKKLSHDKPKGRIFGDAEYNTEYGMYQRSRSELTKLVGDPSVQNFSPQAGLDSGVAGTTLLTLNEWTSIKSYKDDLLASLKTGIPQEQLAIDDIRKSIADATGSTAAIPQLNTAEDSSNKDQLASLQNLLASQAITDAVARATNFSVLNGSAGLVRGRYVGAFAQGGLVPETGMALVHKGEFINPAPDGGYRNGTNAAPNVSVGGGTTELHLHGDWSKFMKLVDARIDDRTANTSVKLGRRQKVISAAPGR